MLWLIDERGFVPPEKPTATFGYWGWSDFTAESRNKDLFDYLDEAGLLTQLRNMQVERLKRLHTNVRRECVESDPQMSLFLDKDLEI